MRVLCPLMCFCIILHARADFLDTLIGEAVRIKNAMNFFSDTFETKHTPAVQPQTQYTPVVQPQIKYTPAVQPQIKYTPVVQPQIKYTPAVEIKHTPAVQPQTGNRSMIDDIMAGLFSNKNTASFSQDKNVANFSPNKADPFVARKKFFPPDVIREIYISPAGDKIAYVTRNNGLDRIQIIPTIGRSAFANVINDNVRIKKMYFVGNNHIVYTCLDGTNKTRLMRVDLLTMERRNISPLQGVDSIHVVEGNGGIVVVSRVGLKYWAHRIGMADVAPQLIKGESNVPLMALFDDHLVPKIYYRGVSSGGVAVFLNDGFNGKRQIDQIDPSKEKYVSVSDSGCHKLTGKNGQVSLVSLDLRNYTQRQVALPGISDISACDVQLDRNRDPFFITVNLARKSHVPLCELAQTHIKNLNDFFNGRDWHRINSTADGNVWLVCGSDPQKPDEYYLYDMRNGNIKHMATANASLGGVALEPTVALRIPTTDGSGLLGYLTKGVNYSIRSPLILIVNAPRHHRWEFSPLVQLLANRGYSVLCINRRGDKNNSTDTALATRDIIDALNWCLKNKIALAGSISIVAKRSSGTMQIFSENQRLMASCVLLSPAFPGDGSVLSQRGIVESIKKPVLVMNELGNGLLISTVPKGVPLTCLGYEKKPNDDVVAGLIETFFARVYKNSNYEKVSAEDCRTIIPLVDGFGLLPRNGSKSIGFFDVNESVYDML